MYLLLDTVGVAVDYDSFKKQINTRRIITNAVPWSQREGHVRVSVVIVLVFGQEAVRKEGLRVRPIAGVVLEAPDWHVHQVTGLEGQVCAG